MRFASMLWVAVVTLAGGWVATSSAATVLDDQFLDGNLNNGTNVNEDDTAWYGINGSVNGAKWDAPTDNTSPLSGTVMRNNNGSATNTSMNGEFPGGTVSLAHPGDKIVLTFDARVTSAQSSNNLNIYLGNNNGTSMTGNEFGTAVNSGDDKLISLALSDTTYFNNTSAHSISFTLELAADGTSLLRSATYDNSAIAAATTTIASPATLSFNEVRFLWNPAGGAPRVDNILVTSVVPEPASLCGLGLAAMALLRPTRRARMS